MQLPKFVWTLGFSVWVVLNNFFLIDATDRCEISINDQKRLFIAVRLYPLSFFANVLFVANIQGGVFLCKLFFFWFTIYALQSTFFTSSFRHSLFVFFIYKFCSGLDYLYILTQLLLKKLQKTNINAKQKKLSIKMLSFKPPFCHNVFVFVIQWIPDIWIHSKSFL